MWSQIGQTSCQEKPGRIVLKSQWGWSWFQRVWILKCPLSTSMLPYQQIVPNDNWLMNSLVNFYFSMWAELTEGCPLLVTVVKSGVSGAEAGWLELTGWRTHKSRLVLTVATPPPHQQLQGLKILDSRLFWAQLWPYHSSKGRFLEEEPEEGVPCQGCINKPNKVGQLLASSRGETIEWNVRWRGSLNLPRFNPPMFCKQ